MGSGIDEYEAAIQRALAGCAPGSVLIQVREKDLDGGPLCQLVRIAQRHAPVSVNDRIDVALATEATAVHLPEQGMPLADARRLFSGIIGVSRHTAGPAAGA